MVVCGTKNKQSLCEPSCNDNIPCCLTPPDEYRTKQKLQNAPAHRRDAPR